MSAVLSASASASVRSITFTALSATCTSITRAISANGINVVAYLRGGMGWSVGGLTARE